MRGTLQTAFVFTPPCRDGQIPVILTLITDGLTPDAVMIKSVLKWGSFSKILSGQVGLQSPEHYSLGLFGVKNGWEDGGTVRSADTVYHLLISLKLQAATVPPLRPSLGFCNPEHRTSFSDFY